MQVLVGFRLRKKKKEKRKKKKEKRGWSLFTGP
jgi:hypothetical protein